MLNDSKLSKARIQEDTLRVYHSYCHIAIPSTFDAWLDAQAEAWDSLTAREMIRYGRAQEVINAIETIYSEPL